MALTRRDVLRRGLVAAPMFFNAHACLQARAEAVDQSSVVSPIRWSSEKKVSYYTQGYGLFVTAHAPAMAIENSQIYLAHAGDAGRTLWMGQPFPLPKSTDRDWISVTPDQVKPFGKAAKISGAPACVRYAGYTAILAVDEDLHGVTCYFFDGNSWASIPVFADGNGEFSPPKAVVIGNQLEVFTSKDGVPRHAFCNGRIFDRSSWKVTAPLHPVFVESLAVSAARVVAVCRSSSQSSEWSQGVYAPQNGGSLKPPFQRLVFSGNSPTMNDDGAVVFVHGDNVGYIYRAAKSDQLFYAYAEGGVHTTGTTVVLQPSVAIPGKSSELPGVAVVGDTVYLAYKGQSTHDMYMLRGDM